MDVLFETEGTHGREEIADYLEQVSENLRAGRVTLVADGDEATVHPPDEAGLRISVESDDGSTSLSFELGWDDDGAED